MTAAEKRLRDAIKAAEQAGDWPSADAFAKAIGRPIRFVSGTYVLQHCGIRVTSTWCAPSMVWDWLEKARAKLADNFAPVEKPRRQLENLE